MKKEISPEERLLSLIKTKNRTAIPVQIPQTAQTPQMPKETPAETVISKADERLDGMLKSELFKNKLFEPAILKSVNKYLVVILGILLLYFTIDLIFVRPYKNVQTLIAKANAPQTQNEKKFQAAPKDITVVKDYSSYSNAVPGKTVFGQSQGGPAAPEDVGASGDISDTIGLVGIIAGDNPQAIIEDKKAQKTYYLNKGQSFNGYVVEDISENKVSLDCEGKKISLFL